MKLKAEGNHGKQRERTGDSRGRAQSAPPETKSKAKTGRGRQRETTETRSFAQILAPSGNIVLYQRRQDCESYACFENYT